MSAPEYILAVKVAVGFMIAVFAEIIAAAVLFALGMYAWILVVVAVMAPTLLFFYAAADVAKDERAKLRKDVPQDLEGGR